jgi:peptide deformylase
MSKLDIVKVPNPILRRKCTPVTDFNRELSDFVADMAETLYSAPGVGLAANQVGVSKQVVVIDTSAKDEPKNLIVLINPQVVEAYEEAEMEEGCLSLPDFRLNFVRPDIIVVKAMNMKGEEMELHADGFLARVFQHEIDHLNGKMLIDYANPIKRQFYLKKRKKQMLKEQQEKEE